MDKIKLENLLNLDELNKEWEIDFENWTVETLKLTKFEEEIIEELTDNVLPRHMPIHDWNLPYAEACLLALRRLVNKEIENKVNIIDVTEDNIDEVKEDIDFTKDKMGLREFLEDNKRLHRRGH